MGQSSGKHGSCTKLYLAWPGRPDSPEGVAILSTPWECCHIPGFQRHKSAFWVEEGSGILSALCFVHPEVWACLLTTSQNQEK